MPEKTTMECEYCEFRGTYPDEVEVRARADGTMVVACKDKEACDERDAAQARALGEEMES